MAEPTPLVSHISALLPRTPIDALKAIAILLLAAGYRNLPLAWHVTTARVVVSATLWRRMRHIEYQKMSLEERGEAIARDFFAQGVLRFRASPGDCD
ncbi:hypothetical protein HDU93_005112, partial [Gonapodya sp. JEL0774]